MVERGCVFVCFLNDLIWQNEKYSTHIPRDFSLNVDSAGNVKVAEALT